MATTPVRYKVPSAASNGSETFADQIVGFQITDGTSQLTNTNFAIDKVISEKDSRDFKTNPFSDFFKLDDLKKEENAPTTTEGTKSKDEKIKFRGDIADAGKSLYGSLKSRLGVSIANIINKFPASIYVDPTSVVRTNSNTAENVTYDSSNNITQFTVQASMFFNPFEITYVQPNSNTIPESINPIRNLYSSFKKYVLDFSGTTYNVISFSQPNANNVVTIKVLGKPFTGSTYTLPYNIRPNNGITEEFFNGLDELEQLLLNRESNPKYQASFKVPRESLDQSKYEISTYYINWPILQDNWNIQISGLDYEKYLYELSSLGDEIDDYKSNLIVRFLSAPQLFEFDTEDQKAQAIFQLYGQSFDRTKKYIDNIAHMRNVTYDGINNVPDILLKNLSETLGLDTHNLFDETSLEDILYTRQPNTYSGLTQGLTIIEAEYEMYRRLLINLAHIYKSKGTRNAIEFFLRFLGAPEPLIKIDEYVYDVVSSPTNRAFESDIQSLISGTKTEYLITGYTFSNTGLTYAGRTITKKTSLSRDEYPIDENGLPRKIFSTTDDIFFQKGAGWYEITKDHRASDIIDLQNSVLTGKTKIIKTIPKNFSYGEEYFDYFRKFPGLDYGFILSPRIDNLKSSNPTDENLEKLILNRKNLNVFLTPAKAIEYDVWRKSSSVKTFAQYVDDLLKENIKNSNSLKYDRHYLGLEKIYLDYINNTGITHYSYSKTNEFIDKLSSRWTKLIEQFIPATTLWLGGNLQSNLNMVRSKHQYKKPCQVYEITEDIHPGDDSNDRDSFFVDEITEIWNALSYASELDSSNGLVNNTQLEDGFMQFYPMFKIDGKIYSGGTVTGITYPHYDADGDGDIDNDPENYLALHALTGCTYALLSGTTNAITGITVNGVTKTVYKSVQLYSGDVEPPTLASLGPDYSSFKAMWKQAIENTVAYINIYSGYTGTTTLPFENNSVAKNTTYGNSIGNSTLTGKTTLPILSYEYITDINGIERIKFKSYKYGPHSCSVMKSFEFLVAYGTNAPDPTPTVTPTMTSTMTMTPTMTSTMTNTPTVTPTLTITPTLTTTPTLTPTTTPTKTIAGTSTPTPTMTPTGTLPLPGCGDIISNTFEPSSGTTQTQNLDLSEAANGSIVSMQYVANDRPNRFAIKEDGLSIVANSGWVGADSTYAGPWGGVGALSGTSSNGSATFTYYTGRSYQLIVDVGPANENGNPPNPSDSWTVTISCLGMPTPTPTNTMTVTPSPFFRYYKVQNCDDPSIIKYTVTYNNNAFTYGNRVYWGSTGITYTVIDTFDPATNTPPVPSYDLIQITRSLDPDTQIPLNNCPSDPAPAYRTAQIFAWTTSAGPYLTDIQAAACGKMPYTLDGYTPINGGSGGWVSDPAITAVTPSTVYTLYDANIGGNVINGGGKWHAVLFTGGGSVVQYIAYITTGGQIQDWTLCAPAVSPTQTPTLTQTPTVTPTLTQTPTSTPVFYWYELTYCDDPTIKGWSVPMSDGASIVGRLYQTGTNTYYTLGTYRNTTDSDPGNGAFGSKLSGTVLGANIDCGDVGHAPPPPITELTLNDLTYDCTNSGTYKGKVYASWANGSGTYEVKAGFLGSGLSSYKSVGGNTSITISDPSNPYDGSTGIRNTTGGSDVFVVYVKDSGGVEKSKMISIGCSYAPPAPSPTSTPASTPAPSPAPPSGASGCATITTEYFYNDVECLGTNYSNGTTTTRFYATLDAISSVNVTIRLNGSVNGCFSTTQSYDILIPAGTISNSVDVTTYSTVDCNSNCIGESISIDSYESLTPNYTICT